MSQNWGPPNQGQQWPNQQGWNQPANHWPNPPAHPQQVANPWANAAPQPGNQPPQAHPWGNAAPRPNAQQQYPPQAYPQQQYPPRPNTQQQYPPQAYPQQPGLQQQFGQPSYGAPGSFVTPAKRKRPMLNVMLGLIFILGLGFFLVALNSYLGMGNSTTAGGDPRQTASPKPSIPVGVPAPDLNPKPAPAPSTDAEGTTWMKSNAVYKQSIAVPTDCAVSEVDITETSSKVLEDHFNEETACLWRVWSPPLTKAGFTLPRPPVKVYNDSVTTACGKAEGGNAFYCGADQRIYYATDVYTVLPKQLRTKKFVADLVVAHEFGHAVQARTGILYADKYLASSQSDSDARLTTRRLEGQADCLSAMFINSVSTASNLSDSDLTNLKSVTYNLGDDVLTREPNYDGEHGLGATRQAWFTTGLSATSVGTCNTFTVPAKKVR